MKGLSIDGLCLEFRIVDPYDGWEFRIYASDMGNGHPTRWEVQCCRFQGDGWLHIDEAPNTFTDFEEAYDCLDNYMQGRWRASGRFD
jgi:hypothetical protein